MQKLVGAQMPKIINHPFNHSLYHGRLSVVRFQRFIAQDRMYLKAYAKILHRLSSRFHRQEHRLFFCELAYYITQTELKLLDKEAKCVKQFTFFPVEKQHIIVPELAYYLCYLNKLVDHAPKEQAVAGILPCFMLYSELGKAMQTKGISTSNPYYSWLSAYISPSYLMYNKQLGEVTNELSIYLDDMGQEAMITSFLKASRCEMKFWDAMMGRQETINTIETSPSF